MGFSDPVAAGEVLVRQSLQSENYVAGVSGWRVGRNGDAEFNNVVARGDVTVGTPPKYIHIGLDGTPSNQPEVLVRSTDGFVSMRSVTGTPYIEIKQDGSFPTDLFRIGTNSNGLSIFTPFVNNANIRFQTNGPVADRGVYIGDGTVPTAVHFSTSDGLMRAYYNGMIQPFMTSTPQNGWGTFSFKRFPDGMVRLRGQPTQGTVSYGVTIATLPVGYRPAFNCETPCVQPGLDNWINVVVQTDGQVRLFKPLTMNFAVDLGNVSFSI